MPFKLLNYLQIMIKSAVTISQVPQLRGGPWILWDDLKTSCEKAAKLGFDGVELFTSEANAEGLDEVLESTGLELAAVGTGAGKVIHGLTLIDADASKRRQAIDFVKAMIDFGARHRAPAIIGSMQGVHSGDKEESLAFLKASLEELGDHAHSQNVSLLYEPLNRYETNLFNRLDESAEFIKTLNTEGVMILADLFHMNIEEVDMAQSIRDVSEFIGHVHFADTNRHAIGLGHLDVPPIAKALKDIPHPFFVSAEAFYYPDPDFAAEQTIKSFRKYLLD